MEVRNGFKQTEVGVIPEGWVVVHLDSQISTQRKITYGIVVPGPFVGDGIPLIRAQDYSRGWVDLDDLYRVARPVDEAYKRSRVVGNDVLLTIVGSVGNVAKVPRQFSGSNITQQTARLAFDERIACRDFFYYLLQSEYGKRQLLNFTKSGVQPSLNLADVQKFLLPIPALAEQRAIATALSDADAWIESLEQLIAKKRQIKQGAMQELLSGKRRLPGFERKRGHKQTEAGVIPEDWDVVALGSLTTTVASGKSGAGAGQGTYPVHGSTGIIGYTERPEYEGDSILAARVGANAGKLNLVSGKYGVTDNTIMLRLRGGYSLPFFWRQLETKRLNSLVFGSGQPLITGSQLKALSLSVPSLPEQRAIATILADMDTEIAMLETKLTKARQTKQGMMQELLTGRIRLV